MILRPFAAALLLAAPAAAQAGRCDGALIPDYGFDRLSITSGSIDQRVEDRAVSFRFSAEPTIGGVRAGGPAAGRLAEGDVLVAIDGEPITTRAGGDRYGAVRRGERATLTVRRDGRTRDVAVTAGERCLPRPPAPPRPPQAAPPRPAPAPAPAPRPPSPPRTGQPGAPAAPPAPPAPAPPPPPAVLPGGWFGFGIQCSDCGTHTVAARPPEFRFRAAPSVVSVEPGTPAAAAGMRHGDRLTHVDGVSLTTPAGWRRFGAIEPGQRVRWTYTRDGRRHEAAMTALARPDAAHAPSAAGADRLRYSGTVGGVRVEARGAPVTVSRDPATGETVIRSADLTVRLRPER